MKQFLAATSWPKKSSALTIIESGEISPWTSFLVCRKSKPLMTCSMYIYKVWAFLSFGIGLDSKKSLKLHFGRERTGQKKWSSDELSNIMEIHGMLYTKRLLLQKNFSYFLKNPGTAHIITYLISKVELIIIWGHVRIFLDFMQLYWVFVLWNDFSGYLMLLFISSYQYFYTLLIVPLPFLFGTFIPLVVRDKPNNSF